MTELTAEQIADGWIVYDDRSFDPETIVEIYTPGGGTEIGYAGGFDFSQPDQDDYDIDPVGAVNDFITMYRVLEPVRPAALQGEAVAWMIVPPGCVSGVVETVEATAYLRAVDYMAGTKIVPLFTSPPDQSTRIADLEKEVERLTIDNIAFRRVHRWSTDRDGPHLMVCRNEHDKGDACEWERFYPPETVEDLKARLARAVEALTPFAEAAKAFAPVISDDDWCPIDFVCGKDTAEITVQVLSFRAAAQFVKEEQNG